MRFVLIALAALVAIGIGLFRLERPTAGLDISTAVYNDIPITIFRRADAPPGPLVVIAHGFAGSQQLMQPFAVTLARNGYQAVTFDFPGHGRNREPMPGGLADPQAAANALNGALTNVINYFRFQPGGDEPLALVGHSMASDVVVRYAVEHPDVQATVAVSMFAPVVTKDFPHNLLVVDGALEPAMMRREAERVVGMVAGKPVEDRVTYGRLSDGSGRRMVLARGVEHIGVLYSVQTQAETLAWLDQTFKREDSGKRKGSGFVERRGPWLGLLFLGLVALAYPLSRLLPRAADAPLGAGLPWRTVLPIAVAPALLTPLLLWQAPTSFLPLLLGDYLMLHFALYGVLTAIGLWLARRVLPAGGATVVSVPKLVLAAAAMGAYAIFALGVPIDRYVTSYMPPDTRLRLIAIMFAGLVPYFLADEWLTRGVGAARGAYWLTKVCFILSLALAVVLAPHKLFFLIIIVPAILLFSIVYGLFSGWAYRRTRHPFVAALANAAAFAWALAVVFPVVAR